MIIQPPTGTADEGVIEKVKVVDAPLAKLLLVVIPKGNAVDVDTKQIKI